MMGLQIDLVLMMLVAFAFGLCIGRGKGSTIHIILTLAAGLGSMIVTTNIMAVLQIVGTVLTSSLLLFGRILAFGSAVLLMLVTTRRLSKST